MTFFNPVNQVRLTNVAIVRLKKGGKRFELACYPNKVLSWRDGIEKDLDEVLQTPTIFEHVSKGVAANKQQLQKAFGHSDEQKMVLEILAKGELQVSEKERQHRQAQQLTDIAAQVADKCVDRETQRPLTVGLIQRAMAEIHYAPNPAHSSKQSALDVIRLLKERLPIQRAQMRLQLSMKAAEAKSCHDRLVALVASLEHEQYSDGLYVATLLCDPGNYRRIEELSNEVSKGKCSLDVLSLHVQSEGDAKIE